MKKQFIRNYSLMIIFILVLLTIFSTSYALFRLTRDIDGEAESGAFSNLHINAYSGNVDDQAYICVSSTTIAETNYAVNSTINYGLYKTISSIEKANFRLAYICLTTNTYSYNYLTTDIISPSAYSVVGQQTNFTKKYRCNTTGIYSEISYSSGEIITESQYNNLQTTDQDYFDEEYHCTNAFTYSVDYSLNQVISIELYELLQDENQKYFSPAYKCSSNIEVDGNILFSAGAIINANDYTSYVATSATIASRVITMNGGDSVTTQNSAYDKVSGLIVYVTFTSTIDSKIRIHIRDEWQLMKYYSSTGVSLTEIVKKPSDKPYNLAAGWHYNVEDGYAYYDDIILATGAENSITIPLIYVGSSIYKTTATYIYSETCTVLLDFGLDVVQANRSEALWG